MKKDAIDHLQELEIKMARLMSEHINTLLTDGYAISDAYNNMIAAMCLGIAKLKRSLKEAGVPEDEIEALIEDHQSAADMTNEMNG